MDREPGTTEIELTGIKEDPGNDCAVALFFDIRGPSQRYDAISVYFSEPFVQRYFRIPWNRDIVAAEKRLIREKQDLFLRWGLLKAEGYLKGSIKEDQILVDFETDGVWAQKAEKNIIVPVSRPKGAHRFVYR